jgi:transcriptional regulator with XRE-family HTH domain
MAASEPIDLRRVAGENVRTLRLVRRLSQGQLARRMTELGVEWSQPAVSTVERGLRALSVDELGALALVLGVELGSILDPGGVEGRTNRELAVGGVAIPPRMARSWARGRVRLSAGADGSLSVEPVEGHEAAFHQAVEEARAGRPANKRRRT